MSTIRLSGAIDRNEPDPQAMTDPMSRWIGSVRAIWNDGGAPGSALAAIVKVCTGRGDGDRLWGQHVLQLRWVGDPPPAEVAQATYDYVRDLGPAHASFANKVIESQPRSAACPSYRVAQARAM